MKKIIFLSFLCFSVLATSQSPNQSSLQITHTRTNPQEILETMVVESSRLGGVTTFTNLSAFENVCAGATFVTEDFSNGPVAFQVCGPVISSAGDGCFAMSELAEGFEIRASENSDVVYVPESLYNTAHPLVGANDLNKFTTIHFTEADVFSVGCSIWSDLGSTPNVMYRVFDQGGILIDEFSLDNPGGTFFFGIVSGTAISRVEIEGSNDDVENIGELRFGNCTLGLDDVSIDGFSLYPNPTTGIVNIKANEVLTKISVYNMLGQEVLRQEVNSEAISISLIDLQDAVYFVKVSSQHSTKVSKIVKRDK